MKSKTEYLTFNALSRCGFINIMHKVAKTVGWEWREGGHVHCVNTMHISASVFINDDERRPDQDFQGSWKSWHPMLSKVTYTTGQARITQTRAWSDR